MVRTRDGEHRPPRPASMQDVARHAGVSSQTVSRFFTGNGYVSDATRGRIEAAIAALGYRRNIVARQLRVQRTDTVGVLTMGQLSYGNAEILSGLSRAARAADVSLMIAEVESPDVTAVSEIRRVIDRLLSMQVDGVVVATPFQGTEKDISDEIGGAVPSVILSSRPLSTSDSVSVDSREAGRAATAHLLRLGHRRILHIAGPRHRNEAVERQQGYEEALDDAGIAPLVSRATAWTAEAGHAVGAAVDPAEFTAVFAGNDRLALGFASALRARGRTAPGDYSLVGVDDMPDSRYLDPPLTTMRMDFHALGVRGFETLYTHIRTGRPQPRVTLQPSLIVRDSAAPLVDSAQP